MTEFFRFPHTPHLAWLGAGQPRDDKVLSPEEAREILSGEVVVEEKVDGANLGLSVDDDGELRVQNRGTYLDLNTSHAQFKPLRRWLDRVPRGPRDTRTTAGAAAVGELSRPADKQADLIPAGWFEAWSAATVATDPVGARQNPPMLRAPNGVVADGLRYWGAGNIPWKPENIKVPTLLIKAEWDSDTPAYMAQNLLPKLTGAPYKRYVELGEGTHTIIMEKNRMNLFREVQWFLDEKHAPAR